MSTGGPAGPGPAWRLDIHAALPSTSDLCAARAAAGEPGGLAILARRQTRGRGSRGRSWESPEGNLYFSALLRPGGDAAEAGRWALLAGVAVAEALLPHLPDSTALRLKWPNDVLLHGRKLGGILVDSALRPDRTLDWLVVGIGLNLAHVPALADRVPACLAEVAPPPAPETMAAAVLDRLAHWERVRAEAGFAPVRAAWLARAHPCGTQLSVRQGASAVQGRFAGLTEDGALLLDVGGSVRALPTGEVLQAMEG